MSLENLDITHPGAREELDAIGISVRRNSYGIGQSIDMTGEQTYMKNTKNAGGNTHFTAREETIRKWVLGCPFQTRFAEALIDLTGLTKTRNNPRTCLRPNKIFKVK